MSRQYEYFAIKQGRYAASSAGSFVDQYAKGHKPESKEKFESKEIIESKETPKTTKEENSSPPSEKAKKDLSRRDMLIVRYEQSTEVYTGNLTVEDLGTDPLQSMFNAYADLATQLNKSSGRNWEINLHCGECKSGEKATGVYIQLSDNNFFPKTEDATLAFKALQKATGLVAKIINSNVLSNKGTSIFDAIHMPVQTVRISSCFQTAELTQQNVKEINWDAADFTLKSAFAPASWNLNKTRDENLEAAKRFRFF